MQHRDRAISLAGPASITPGPINRTIALRDENGENKVVVSDAIPIVTDKPRDRSLLVAGAKVIVDEHMQDSQALQHASSSAATGSRRRREIEPCAAADSSSPAVGSTELQIAAAALVAPRVATLRLSRNHVPTPTPTRSSPNGPS